MYIVLVEKLWASRGSSMIGREPGQSGSRNGPSRYSRKISTTESLSSESPLIDVAMATMTDCV